MSAETPTPASDSEQAAASLLGLPLRFEAVLDEESEEDLFFISYGKKRAEELDQQVKDKVGQYWSFLVPCYLALGLGFYGCLIAEMVLSATLIAVVVVFVGNRHRTINKNIRAQGFERIVSRRLEFVIINSGLIEDDQGVRSICDWSCMEYWVLSPSLLFIQLKNGKAAVIPRKHMNPQHITLEHLCSFMKIKGVNGRKITREP
jgi:hypothetical protein